MVGMAREAAVVAGQTLLLVLVVTVAMATLSSCAGSHALVHLRR
jgi:hypothetical protein